jgi:hypothetical protein
MAETPPGHPRVAPFIRRNQRTFALLAILLFVGMIKLGQQFYRWVAFEEERERISALSSELEEAGLGVIASQLRSDSIRSVVGSIDEDLAVSRERLDVFERQLSARSISAGVERDYRRELTTHNLTVEHRNDLLSEWMEVIEMNHQQVARYNALVDSIRALASEMGEPYYPIPSPAEIASRNGIPAPGAAPE